MKNRLNLLLDGNKAIMYCLMTYMLVGIGQLVGMIITYLVFDVIIKIARPELITDPCLMTAKEYFPFVGIWIVFVCYFSYRKMEKGILSVLGSKLRGNNILCFICGLLIGFAMNFTCGYLAMKNGDFEIAFTGFKPLQTLLIFLVVMIQSGAEELLCRGVLYKSLERRFGEGLKPIVVSSLLFAALHLFNSGLTILSLMNLVLAGIVPALMMYYFDSLWMCIAEHTAWNFTQNILLGLPNSGIRVPFSIFALSSDNIKNSFFYNVGFGIEGSMMALVVQLVVIALMYVFMNKRKKPAYDVWQGISEQDIEKAEQDEMDIKITKQIKKYTEKDYRKKLKKDPEYSYKQLLDYEVSREEKAKKGQYVSMALVVAVTLALCVFNLLEIETKQMVAVLFGELIAMILILPMSRQLVNRRIELLNQYLSEKIEYSNNSETEL